MKKYFLLLIFTCSILVDVFIICASSADLNIPKLIWLLFAVCSFVSAAYNFSNYRTYRDKEKK